MSGRLAIIPARGGSKRLPRKNVMPFNGKPILAYTVEAALATGLFTRVVVSTEDPEIAAAAAACGAEVDARPASLATDASTVVEVCADLLARERRAGRDYDVLCCLYATAPLRNAADVAATMALIDPARCDFSMAVTRYMHYAHQAMRLAADGGLSLMWPELAEQRADRLGTLVAGNGSTYCAVVPEFLRLGTFYGPGLRGHEMPLERSVDIDTREDFAMALAMARYYEHESAAARRPDHA